MRTTESEGELGKDNIIIFPNSVAKEFDTEEKLREYLLSELPTRRPPGRYNFRSYRSVKSISEGTTVLFRFQDVIVGFATVEKSAKLSSKESGYEGFITMNPHSIRLLNRNLSIKRLEEIINHEMSLHFKKNYKTGRGYRKLPSKYNKQVIEELNRLSHSSSATADEDEFDRSVAMESLDGIKHRLRDYEGHASKKYYGKITSRDQWIISELKRVRNYRCQLCGVGIKTKSAYPYVEGAHIVPKSEEGSEAPWNILILCPNHHKEFDLGERVDINHTRKAYSFRLNGKEFDVDLNI